ncbi:MAG: hypothetical protein AAF675_13915 [Pseudomonadota bacterium]
MTKVAIVGWAVIAVFLFGVAEVGSYLALNNAPHVSSGLYTPPEVSRDEYDAFIAIRDPELGWPTEGWLETRADEKGARRSPMNAALGAKSRPCVSLYGDSFTFSDEARDEDAWGNVLASSLGCRVENYGVGGYGTDQALMRLERHLAAGHDIGPTVILSMYPDNLNRNVNQWRYLLTGGSKLGFKPAFVERAEGFAQAPIFSGDFEAFQMLARDPAAVLEGEAYLPDAPGLIRQVTYGFPFSATLTHRLAKLVRSYRDYDSASLINFSNYPVYYDSAAGVSDEKKRVAQYIQQRFASRCEEHALRCLFVLIPDGELLYQRDNLGRHDLEWVIDEAPEEIAAVDASVMYADLKDFCEMLTGPSVCRGHFNPKGYARFARFILGEIDERGLMRRR